MFKNMQGSVSRPQQRKQAALFYEGPVDLLTYPSPPTPNATTCPLRLRGLKPTPRLWLKCNRLLRLGRPVGAVTLSR